MEAKQLLSVGLDVGTTSTQMIVSQLTVQNRAGAFAVPEMEIAGRKILYQSPVHFTPLLNESCVDGERLRCLIGEEYIAAGISREQVDTGAVIITGETSRKENSQTVLENLSDLAGDFVVATAGPDLESVLAAKGAGAVRWSEETGKRVLHMDIGGGTSNLALIENGKIKKTGCLNVGGRLLKLDENGRVGYISPVLRGLCDLSLGQQVTQAQVEAVADILVQALEMAAQLREKTALLEQLTTAETTEGIFSAQAEVISFSGGVADCIEKEHPWLAFGDMGPVLGRAIGKSRLCAGEYRLGEQTIRATVIGAGCHSTQLSGSTVYHRTVRFPLKNLPVVEEITALGQLDGPGVLAMPGTEAASYEQIRQLADQIAAQWPHQPVYIALEADMAKALGHALALRLGKDMPILCIDRVKLEQGSYLDVGAPVDTALPLVVKTLILSQ